ncbi:MAG: peptide chain release factor N(5)-glutamine methyltransferase [Chloroflexi bacterium]|nr:peptide chain release factor N(5)-glutamine methyltransferase [Chloroflexota bacterium]
MPCSRARPRSVFRLRCTEATPRSVDEWRRQAVTELRAAGVDTPLLDANVLLGEVLDLDPGRIPLCGDQLLTAAQSRRAAAMVQRRAAREPVAYIVGRRSFANGSVQTTADVLVPRPETETLVSATLAVTLELQPRAVIDVGTGSGAVAVALARELPEIPVIASDVSRAALGVARDNLADWGVASRIRLLRADGLRAMCPRQTVVTANLPYIPSAVIPTLEPEVSQWEPRQALDGGPDGLAAVRSLMRQCAQTQPLAVILEVAHDQRVRVSALAAAAGFTCHAVHRDLAGFPRVLDLRPIGAG